MECPIYWRILAVLAMVYLTRGGGNVADLSYALEKPLQIDIETKIETESETMIS